MTMLPNSSGGGSGGNSKVSPHHAADEQRSNPVNRKDILVIGEVLYDIFDNP